MPNELMRDIVLPLIKKMMRCVELMSLDVLVFVLDSVVLCPGFSNGGAGALGLSFGSRFASSRFLDF